VVAVRTGVEDADVGGCKELISNELEVLVCSLVRNTAECEAEVRIEGFEVEFNYSTTG